MLQIRSSELLSDGRILIDTRGLFRIRVLHSRLVDDCVTVSYEVQKDLPVDETKKAGKCKLIINIHIKNFSLIIII